MRQLTGTALLLAASLLLRYSILARERRQRRTLRALADAFSTLERAVRLTLTPLPALLRDLSCAAEARAFFDEVSEGLARGEALEPAWKYGARQLPLGEREKEAVAALGPALCGDEQSVCAALMRAQETLSDAECTAAAREGERARVTTALCLGGGALVCILLL